MDKNAIKKYAVWARLELITRVRQRAVTYGVLEDNAGDPNADSVGGRLLSPTEKSQRQALIRKVKEDGYGQVMEEVAYTWFNRFAALRFMEVNGYLPSHVRVFTNDAGEFKPQILAEAIHLELDGLDRGKVYALEQANKTEELFKYLLIVQCNALSSILPGMFQRINDYTELLLPDYLLREGSVIERMVRQNAPDSIPEGDWTDQVQIIGWLYEAYNNELNALVYDGSMSKSRITKDLLPPATTIYTPDWPVHYMVENSLGRLWLEGHPNDDLKTQWQYYLDEAEQEPDVQAQLAELRKEYAAIKPEDIRVIDPCMGSGHILCVLFDVLVQIYGDYGYTPREAVVKIMENNLYGLDIDDRAGQLAYFSVMMKARKYDRRYFSHPVQPHVYAIAESNGIGESFPFDMGDFLLSSEHRETLRYLLDTFHDAKEYGSILKVEQRNYAGFLEAWELTAAQTAEEFGLLLWYDKVKDSIPKLAKLAIVLAQKYDVVVTNPPYLGSSRFSPALDEYVKANYADVKSDLCMVTYKQAVQRLCKRDGFVAFITTSSWMFIASFEKLRDYLNHAASIVSLVDFGTELFDGKVGHNAIVAWVTRVAKVDYKMTAIRLVDYCYSRRDEKEQEFFGKRNHYNAKQSDFSKIPGSPAAYWASKTVYEVFSKNEVLSTIAKPRQGMVTRDNQRFMRLWWEISDCEMARNIYSHEASRESSKRWYPCTTGGPYRKWYGNNEMVVDFQNDGREIIAFSGSHIKNREFYFLESITWTAISSGKFSMRYAPKGFLPEHAGDCLYGYSKTLKYMMAICNSVVGLHMLSILSPTLNYNVGDVARIPIVNNQGVITSIEKVVDVSIHISRADWDSFETSWDFQRHPMLPVYADEPDYAYSVEAFYEGWKNQCQDRFDRLKANEEELNRIFIDIYGLQDELAPEVEDKDVTVRLADLGRDVRSLISYAVGCMFGRYSLDKPGLVYAGGDWDSTYKVEKGSLTDEDGDAIIFGDIRISIAPPPQINYDGVWKNLSFAPDADNIIPICDDDYFEDDIVGRFIQWLEIAYGKKSLEENLEFIAGALGGKGTPREVLRSYFLNDFYADHLKIYQKRPIYWLFDSGKKNGFKCLIYMHRYQPDTIARIRTDYVHEQQSRYRTAITDLERRINDASPSERVKLTKQFQKLQDQAEEVRVYEEKIHHLADQMIKIDLDDGVKHNYALFQDVLAKIK